MFIDFKLSPIANVSILSTTTVFFIICLVLWCDEHSILSKKYNEDLCKDSYNVL